MLVWFRAGHPAAPVPTLGGDLKSGNRDMQPQARAPRPVAEPRADTPATTASPTATPSPEGEQ
jgi:hypothetical protein